MRTFNIWGNTDQSEFENLFKGVIYLLEIDVTGAHDFCNIYGMEELGKAYN